MSLSSLPDIFRQSATTHLTCRKQGGPFSLHLGDQSTNRNLSCRSAYASIDNNRINLPTYKLRSASTASVAVKPSILRDENNRRTGTAMDKMTVNFKEEVLFLTKSGVKQKVGLSIINVSNFPYESSRRFNNMTIDMQQTDNLKNITEFNLREIEKISNSLQQSNKAVVETKFEMENLNNRLNNDMDQFQQAFSESLREFYSLLSKLRRETNQQLKGNRTQLQKITYQFQISQNFANDLTFNISKLASQCIKSPIQKDTSNGKESSPRMDFQELSQIRKTSRGGTGDQSRRTRLYDLLKKNDNSRKSADWNILEENHGTNWQDNLV